MKMKFRVRNIRGEIEKKNDFFLRDDGVVFFEGENMFGGISPYEGKRDCVEFLIGKDSLGNDVYENDILLSEYSVYTAGFDLEMGAVLISKNGGKTPFKHSVEKLVVKEAK